MQHCKNNLLLVSSKIFCFTDLCCWIHLAVKMTSAEEPTLSECFIQSSVLIKSAIDNLAVNEKAKHHIQMAFKDAFIKCPGLATQFIVELAKSLNVNTNIYALLLKQERFTPAPVVQCTNRKELIELTSEAEQLKSILCSIPDTIGNRQTFLESIKQIAAAIKKNIDAVNVVMRLIENPYRRNDVDSHKKEFVRSSRHFSNTLKTYFRANNSDDVFISAARLITQTNDLLGTIRHSL
ncbi:hypothetical protein GJ496_004114 [Pomphorhynchus laevis]|nr:hypothetical protein GJ496_004114 [Pomphorhynchus laevis]